MARMKKAQAHRLQDDAWDMHLQGLSHVEIARVQGTHVNTIANRIAAKKKRMQAEDAAKSPKEHELDLTTYLDFVLKGAALHATLSPEDKAQQRARYYDTIVKATNSKFAIQSATGTIDTKPKEVHGTLSVLRINGQNVDDMDLVECNALKRQIARELALIEADARVLPAPDSEPEEAVLEEANR